MWLRGIGNDTDQVGRYIVANPFFYARGTASTNPQKIQEELYIPTIGSRFWDTPAYQREGKFLMNRSTTPSLNLARMMGQGQSVQAIEAATTGAQTMELQGTIQTFSHFANRVSLASGFTRFGLPRTAIDTPVAAYDAGVLQRIGDRLTRLLRAMGYAVDPSNVGVYPQRGDHAMCTTRMSGSPTDGVVDRSFRVHGTENLYVLSNAIFPSGAAANPTLTMMGLGFLLLDQLTGREMDAT
jgi:choline dehydrogenase-like flavoprotein